MAKYTKDFQVTGGGLMETFLGMQVEQSKGRIRPHLDNYIRETLDEYKEFSTKSLRPKQVPIQPGLILEKTDCPIVPDPRKQKFYQSFIAKLQFAASATWIHFDISFAVAQLARFRASAGKTHWAALHSFDGVSRSAFEFQADLAWPDWFCGFGLGYELIAPLYDSQLVPLQSLADLLAIEAAEDNCSVDSRGGVLLSIHCGC